MLSGQWRLLAGISGDKPRQDPESEVQDVQSEC